MTESFRLRNGGYMEYSRFAPYLVVPKVSWPRWDYLPAKFMAQDMAYPPMGEYHLVVRDARLYHFGILSSSMHMAWLKFESGALEGKGRAAPKTFKAFPWP